MNRAEVEALVAETLAKAEKIYARPFTPPVLCYDIQGVKAGQFRAGEIRLNPTWLDEPDFNETVIHEVAHYVQRSVYADSQSHGDEWRAVMLALGVPPERTHHYDMGQLQGRHPYWCECSQYHVSDRLHQQMLAGQMRLCGKCRTYLKPGLKPQLEWKPQQCGLCNNMIPAQGKQLTDYPKWGQPIGYVCYEHRNWKLKIAGGKVYRQIGSALQFIRDVKRA